MATEIGSRQKVKQAEAELCQAQDNLSLVNKMWMTERHSGPKWAKKMVEKQSI